MATLWETVTGNSTLPVQAGNTFWDHLQNQAGGGGGPTQLLVVEAFVETNRIDIDATIEPLDVEVEVESLQLDVTIEDGIAVEANVDRTEILQ